ncbi:TPM domain-containing protein [Rhodoferax sp.]|uniref:TPM domain-containing protein n=1 Tax=Rhodoferax sp. TaxID=50421 RepID=UPI0025E6CC79|nr:TPM domain-containing protein [Rhodoferax sp.]
MTRLLVGLLLLGSSTLFADTLLAIPPLTARVIDTSSVLTAADIQQLELRLSRLEAETGSQVVVWLLPSSDGEDIAALANRVANTWKLGRKVEGDGVLLLVAVNDKRMRIEVAKSLEGAIPDVQAGRIIQQKMAPLFRTGDYAGGLQAAIGALAALIQAEALPAPMDSPPSRNASVDVNVVELGVFVFFVSAIGGNLARQAFGTRFAAGLVGLAATGVVFYITQLWWVGLLAGLGGFILSLLMSRSSSTSAGYRKGGYTAGGMGGSSSSSSDSGSGGFHSGGGGNFGGGGASGGW